MLQKKTTYLLSFLMILGTIGSLNAQKVRVVSGKPGVINGQETMDIEYIYDGMRVGKFVDEKDYIDKKVKEYNEDEPGSGDTWVKAWIDDRETRFQPKFEELLNKYLAKSGISISQEDDDSKYTMLVKTTFTEPGWNAFVMKRPAIVDLEIRIVESANPDKTISKITVEKAPGATYGYGDLDTGTRIAEAYAKAAKELGKLLTKKYLK